MMNEAPSRKPVPLSHSVDSQDHLLQVAIGYLLTGQQLSASVRSCWYRRKAKGVAQPRHLVSSTSNLEVV